MSTALLLGAHVSSAGGVARAPARGAEIGATVIQLFTKPIHRWAEPSLARTETRVFRREREAAGLRVAGSHDSYLINLASADRSLFRRSLTSFRKELRRAAQLELDFVVTHPGNATTGTRDDALARNADAIAEALAAVPGRYRLLLEGTAGQGVALGATFDELARFLDRIPGPLRSRVGICLDTAHLWAAGYDLVHGFDDVFAELDATLGLSRLGLLHLNDSKAALGSHLDRHEHISKGTLGDEPFRRIMTDRRLAAIPKVIETPKEDDAVRWDRRNLRRLRAFATTQAAGAAAARGGRRDRGGQIAGRGGGTGGSGGDRRDS